MKKYITLTLIIIVILVFLVLNILIKNIKSEDKVVNNKIAVVAVENQYGSIAKLIGGNNVKVDNIINNADGDPHNFISSIKTAKILSKVDVIIYNGADYDSWIKSILNNNKNIKVIKIEDIVKKTQLSKFGINPHLWYDPDTFSILAVKLKDIFSKHDPINTNSFNKNLKTFNDRYQKVYDMINKIKKFNLGTCVTATEPLYNYMVNALGLNMKGLEFQWIIMNGSEPSPKIMIDYQELFKDKKVKILFYNKQVINNVTKNILKLAKNNKIPIVGITETMPQDEDAISWIIKTLDLTISALEKSEK